MREEEFTKVNLAIWPLISKKRREEKVKCATQSSASGQVSSAVKVSEEEKMKKVHYNPADSYTAASVLMMNHIPKNLIYS